MVTRSTTLRRPFKQTINAPGEIPSVQLAEDWTLHVPPQRFKTAIYGQVIHVFDGDTLSVAVGPTRKTIRLAGIDAPELYTASGKAQPGAAESRAALSLLCLGVNVHAMPTTLQSQPDRFGRLVCHVLRAHDRLELGLEMIRQGYAKPFPGFPHEFAQAYASAAWFASILPGERKA